MFGRCPPTEDSTVFTKPLNIRATALKGLWTSPVQTRLLYTDQDN